MADRNAERRLRRALDGAGYALRKSRSRSWSYDDQLGYMIVDLSTNCVVWGGRFDCDIDDVAEFVETRCRG